MKRKDFVEKCVAAMAIGRRKHHPNIRPAEAAMAAVNDAEFARRQWRKMSCDARQSITDDWFAQIANGKE